MFSFFKIFSKDKKISQVAANIATTFNCGFLEIKKNNNNSLPKEFLDDKFLLGYIVGSCSISSRVFGLKKPEHSGMVIINVHEFLFPDDRKNVTNRCKELVAGKDKLYAQGMEAGASEYYKYLEGAAASDVSNLTSLQQLGRHLKLTYAQYHDI